MMTAREFSRMRGLRFATATRTRGPIRQFVGWQIAAEEWTNRKDNRS